MSNLPKILSFSGRKHSGKTLLTQVCIKYNYELINFADSLKELVCNSLNISRDYLEEYKDTPCNYDLTKKIKYISNEINIEEKIVSEFLAEPFDSIRKILQIIGTDLIRKHNEFWHINKIKEKILNNPNKYYCIGDTRFINEKKMVEDLKGECWFIIRPIGKNISNHPSEINLLWTDFGNNIIINNGSKQQLINSWNEYLSTISTIYKGPNNVISVNNLGFEKNETFIKPTKEICYIMGLMCNKNFKYNIYRKIFLSKIILKTEKERINQLFELYFSKNPFIIENIKLWHPLSSKNEPVLLKTTNSDYLYWIIGLIDGNSIFNSLIYNLQ